MAAASPTNVLVDGLPRGHQEVMMRFCVVHNIPSPYRLHLFRTLRSDLRQRSVELQAHFMSHSHAIAPLRGSSKQAIWASRTSSGVTLVFDSVVSLGT